MIATLSKTFLIEKIYNCFIILLAQWYTNLLSPDGVHAHISLSLRLLVLCLVGPALFLIYITVYFFKELISFIQAPLTNATPAFSTLWYHLVFHFKRKYSILGNDTWPLSGSNKLTNQLSAFDWLTCIAFTMLKFVTPHERTDKSLLACLQLTLFQTSPGINVSEIQIFWKHCGKREIAHNEQFLLFPVFSTCLENYLPFSSKSKLWSANSFSLEESKICCLGKG